MSEASIVVANVTQQSRQRVLGLQSQIEW